MKLLMVALAGVVACSHPTGHDAPAAARAAPGGGTLTATDGKPVEVASLYQGHCAVLTFYRGFF